MTTSKKAYAKINLTLEILGTRRGDGFHDIASVMHKVTSLYDEVSVCTKDEPGLALICDKDVCAPEQNLAWRAAVAYAGAASQKGKTIPGLLIELKKRIPSGAGLAGGSADAAAVLRALDEMCGVLSEKELFALALSLGSDIPFCLYAGECALCTGRGEVLEPLPGLKNVQIEVCFPKTPLFTSGIYAEYDKRHGEDYTKNKSRLLAEALKGEAPLQAYKHLLCNDFQELCEERCPEIVTLCEALSREGYAAQMSGSGSAVFGLKQNKTINI